MKYYLQRDKLPHEIDPQHAALIAKVRVIRDARQSGKKWEPLSAEELERLHGYLYALGPSEIRAGDITIPAGWGSRAQAVAARAGYDDSKVAGAVAYLLGCGVTTLPNIEALPASAAANRAPAKDEWCPPELASERKGRVATFVAKAKEIADKKARDEATAKRLVAHKEARNV